MDAPDDTVPRRGKASSKSPGFKRVYQACENCQQKKQKCSLGDPANPKRPCKACCRANIPCGKVPFPDCSVVACLLTLQSSPRKSEKGVPLEKSWNKPVIVKQVPQIQPGAVVIPRLSINKTEAGNPDGKTLRILSSPSRTLAIMVRPRRPVQATLLVTGSQQVTINKWPVKHWPRFPFETRQMP